MKKIQIFFLIIFVLNLNAVNQLFHDNINFYEEFPTFGQYSSLNEDLRCYLRQKSYREIANPDMLDYQLVVRNILRVGELLSGTGISFASSRQGNPYTVTEEDKQLAFDIFTFVSRELPQEKLNRGLQDWARAGFLHLAHIARN